MQTSHSPKPHNRVDYYSLHNGYADVFLHRNETIVEDEEGSKDYVAEEVYFQIDRLVTKEQIEENFDYFWEDAEKSKVEKPTAEERLQMAEDTILFLLMGGM